MGEKPIKRIVVQRLTNTLGLATEEVPHTAALDTMTKISCLISFHSLCVESGNSISC